MWFFFVAVARNISEFVVVIQFRLIFRQLGYCGPKPTNVLCALSRYILLFSKLILHWKLMPFFVYSVCFVLISSKNLYWMALVIVRFGSRTRIKKMCACFFFVSRLFSLIALGGVVVFLFRIKFIFHRMCIGRCFDQNNLLKEIFLRLVFCFFEFCVCYRFRSQNTQIRYKVIMKTGLCKQTKIITICWFMPHIISWI